MIAKLNANPQPSPESYDRKKKAFLRQVYTNMQNTETNKKRLFDKYSKNLEKDLNNAYIRRTKIDNEWHVRVMNSKLLAFEECCASNNQMSIDA